MGARERMLALRLLEKAAKRSEYVKDLGIEIVIAKAGGNGKRL